MFEVLEASITPAVGATVNMELGETVIVPLELEARTTPVVDAALNTKLDEAMVVPFEPPKEALLQPVAWAS